MRPNALLLLAAQAVLVAAKTVNVPLSCNPTCTSAINAAIASCSGSPSCIVQLAAGTYILDGPPYAGLIYINGAQNLTVAGAGAGSWGPGGSGNGVGSTMLLTTDIANVFLVSGGANIVFTGFSIDMQRVAFTYGQVTSVSGGSSTVTFDATQYPINLQRYPWLSRAQGVLSYNPVAQHVAQGTDIYALDNPLNITYGNVPPAPGTNATLTLAGTSLILNDWVIVRHQTYSYNAFQASQPVSIAWVNVTLLCVAGMGVYTDRATGTILFDNFRIVKSQGRPMSITADGIHTSNSVGAALIIRNSVFEGQGDDGLNCPTLFNDIEWLNVNGGVTTLKAGSRGTITNQPVATAGGTINVYNRSNMAVLGTANVASVAADGTITLAAPGLPAGAGMFSSFNNPAYYASYVELTDNAFLANRARGALLKSSNVYAARNTFRYCSGPAIKTETDGAYWFEGHPVRNWTVTDNIIDSVNFGPGSGGSLGDIAVDSYVSQLNATGGPTSTSILCGTANAPYPVPVQYDVTINSNTITQVSGMPAVTVFATDGLQIQNNIVTRAAGAPHPQYDFQGFTVVNSAVSGNMCDGAACKTTGV